MTPDLLDILACPKCADEQVLVLADGAVRDGGEIIEGHLDCPCCKMRWPIIRGIPRFVGDGQDYAGNFSYQWRRWGQVQVDRLAGHTLSQTRFLTDSGWDPDWITGKLVLDAGCGAGRFTDVVAGLGARVVAVDLSGAVDACRGLASGPGRHVNVVQASFYELPFRKGVFDALFCMGVIQHTPDPERTMTVLPCHLKPGGVLSYNWYEVSALSKLQPVKYALRWVTPHLPFAVLHALSLVLTVLLFPLAWVLSFIPKLRIINVALPICVSLHPGLTLRQQFLWTLLDTFDWYSPRYEIRQRKRRVAELLRGLGLDGVSVSDGVAVAHMPDTKQQTEG